MPVDIEPATTELGRLVRDVPDDTRGRPTPCGYSVDTLLDHIATLATAFTHAAEKRTSASTEPPPAPDASHLPPDWRTAIPHALDRLADAWKQPDAWEGMTIIAGTEMPGEAVGVVALDEVVLHGWDLARATDQPFDVDPQLLDALTGFLDHMAEPGMEPAREGLFGPVVAVPTDAPLLERVLGLAGRDPGWRS